MNNIEEFYMLQPLYTLNLLDIYQVNGVEFFPELGFSSNVINPSSLSNFKEQVRVKIEVVKERTINKGSIYEKTTWSQCYVAFDIDNTKSYTPYMIIFNETREDYVFPKKYITDTETYRKAIYYLFSLLVKEDIGTVKYENNKVKELFIEGLGGRLLQEPLKRNSTTDNSKFLEAYRNMN